MFSLRRYAAMPGLVMGLALVLAAPVSANHSWEGFHWARTSNPFTIQLGDNVSGLWDDMLRTASSDWSSSSVLDTRVVAGRTTGKLCRPTRGRVEVCNANYRGQQWLGLAQVWLSGSHIVQGTVKNNDYYFGSSSYPYNNTAEMLHVMCQEIGHTFGLGHQSENGDSLDSCMDYYANTSASDMQSTSPNAHDFTQLETIYGHRDSSTTIGSGTASSPGRAAGAAESSWGRLVASSASGRQQTFQQDLGRGQSLLTFVIWAH